MTRTAAPRPRAERTAPARRRRLWLAAAALLVAAVVAAWAVVVPDRAAAATLFAGTKPNASVDSEIRPVELGVRFSSRTSGTVVGIRFYKTQYDVGTHVGTLWTSSGKRLAQVTFSRETASGWQRASFGTPVRISAGETYVASYWAPQGRYTAANDFYAAAYHKGDLTVPSGGGVYSYQRGAFPDQRWRNSNYYVDVEFSPQTSSAPTTTAPTSGPTSTAPTSAPTTSAPTTSAPAPTATATGGAGALSLPRIPWEGGSAFWSKYPRAAAAGWDDPSFFPIIAWFNGVSNDAEVAYDKSLGINTYIGMWEGTQYQIFERNGVFWAGGKLNSSFTPKSRNWVGVFLDDEVDGRFTPAEGRAHLTALAKEYEGQGLFTYANYTQIVMSEDSKPADAEWYVNQGADVVSLDMYWYTIPYCSITPYRDVYLTPVAQKYCRTASSYGKSVQSLRARDATDGQLKPIWQWVENLNGGPGEGPFTAYITPSQLKGAVMNSIIHEARGIAYFNQSFTGSCQGGSIFRQSQVTSNFCGAPQVAAAKQVNGQIKQLAPILNSQSYVWSFGSGMDTMLKADGQYAYVFAMVDGHSDPGSRSLTLPPEVRGRSVEVMFENRTLTADSGGSFTDTFAQESSYHIYRVRR